MSPADYWDRMPWHKRARILHHHRSAVAAARAAHREYRYERGLEP